jgi:hypothetical protein
MYCECGKKSERIGDPDDTDCASCKRMKRKAAAVKIPDDPKPINKQSEQMSKALARYGPMKKTFIHGRWCGVHGKPCLPVDIHHARGRGLGFEDSHAEERGIPRLLDTRFWLAVCREAHREIELNPTWAKANGYSEDRLTAKI